VFTWSGSSARFLAGLRPRGPIFAMSPNPRVVNALSLVWGVTSLPLPEGVDSVESMIDAGERTLLSEGLVHPGEEIVILGGNGPVEGSTNFVKFHVIGA
jgi:pyruvate kinase